MLATNTCTPCLKGNGHFSVVTSQETPRTSHSPSTWPLIKVDLPTSASCQASTIQHIRIGAKSSLKVMYHGTAANGDSKRSMLHFNPKKPLKFGSNTQSDIINNPDIPYSGPLPFLHNCMTEITMPAAITAQWQLPPI